MTCVQVGSSAGIAGHMSFNCESKENGQPAGLLQPLPVSTRKWDIVSMALITALPKTASGNTAIVMFGITQLSPGIPLNHYMQSQM